MMQCSKGGAEENLTDSALKSAKIRPMRVEIFLRVQTNSCKDL